MASSSSKDFFQTSGLGGSPIAGIGPVSTSDIATNASGADLRRRFNFGDRVSELSIAQDPFFRFVSQVAKKPTDDPTFKFTEKRHSFHKRYAYPSAFSADNATYQEGLNATNPSSVYDGFNTAGSTVYVKMVSDYKSDGNIQNIFGNTTNEIVLGSEGTQPKFFLQDQLVKIPFSDSAAGSEKSYAVIKIDSVTYQDESTNPPTAHGEGEAAILKGKVVKAKTSGDTFFAGPLGVSVPAGKSVAATSIAGADTGLGLEASRCYVVGTAHGEGTGYPETWKDQPYSQSYGLTQIFKTSCAMTNTARATVLKYEPDEWARTWKDKLIEHKYDIEQSLLFGSQATVDSVNYTQGAVDYILNFGNQFTMDLSSKTADDFLDDMSNYLDPRYNNGMSTMFFVSTPVYNWMHKMGGYFKNNVEISTNFRADFAMVEKKKILGVDVSTFATPYGDMNVARNIHLDGSEVKMLGINMKYCAYRPLVGNGVNRDTSVYVGVQTLENSGIDRRVDLILTEAGMEWCCPETHAVWK